MSMGGHNRLISVFTRHRTASNLLMLLMIIGGLIAYQRINTQFFPDFGLDLISVRVDWPGASAEDLDANVVQALEPEVRFLDGVKRVFSDSIESKAFIIVEFLPGTDMQNALANVETAVGQVTTLPEDSEKPVIYRPARYDPISRLLLSGPFPDAALKAYAEKIRDDLMDRGIGKVDLLGARDEEILVEVAPETLRRLNLTIDDMADKIARSSKDLPSGGTKGQAGRQIRSLGLVKDAEGIAAIEVRAFDDGRKILLGDMATVREAYAEEQVELYSDGHKAVEIFVQRAISADALKQADIVEAYLAEIRSTLPPGMVIEQYDIMSQLIKSRMELLLKNGVSGLVLVLGILFLFLNFRVALWVAVGIPVSLLATLVLMLATGQSINMISLFALIMVIGIIVDDAIVVGEHAEALAKRGPAEKGLSPIEAAETGASRMAVPVLASSLTTIAAFAPLLMIGDIIGKLITAIPYVAIVVILASLVECFLVLPGHMRHAIANTGTEIGAFRQAFNRLFNGFRDGLFRRIVETAVRWRYATIATAIAFFILALGVVVGGRVGFNFFVSPEADKLYANIAMVAGTPREETLAALMTMDAALQRVENRLTDGKGGVVKHHHVMIGHRAVRELTIDVSGDTAGSIVVELVPSDERDVRTKDLIAEWWKALPTFAGVDALTILPAETGPPGKDIDIRLSGENILLLKQAALDVKQMLDRYPGVASIEDDLPYGKEETILEITPRGEAFGFTTDSVGRQVRNAFQGAIAKRFPRGDEEITVRIRYPRHLVEAGSLEGFLLRAPSGAEVALDDVVTATDKQGIARVRREDGARRVAITAKLDLAVVGSNEIIASLKQDGIEDLAAKYGVGLHFAGKQEEQERTFGDMRTGALVGFIAIYIILAWVFSSYSQPIVVMSIIPLGFVGTVLGHMIMGYDITILSMVALIGLSGIVVNDSIILVSTIKEHLAAHENKHDAIVNGCCERLRAVILTSGTTIGGLTPLLFETSLQAQFLLPMALTLVFGLIVTTLLVLLVVPALLGILEDFGHLRGRLGFHQSSDPFIVEEPIDEAAE